MMTPDLTQIEALLAKAEGDGKTLRFSCCEAGYRWASAQTNCVDRMRFLLACWNNRHALIAAARERERVRWQPIETAPRDETDCLVTNDRGQFVAWFDSSWDNDGWWMVSDGKNIEYPLRGKEPTHWMPLPGTPALKDQPNATD